MQPTKSFLGLDDSPLVIAHRGFAIAAPENTIAAFEAAFGAGAHVVESDIQVTRDGIAVLFHDSDLNRIFKVPRRVDQLSFEELSSLRVDGHQIPTLAQVLQHFPTQKFNLDVKTSAAIRPTALELVKFEALDRVLLTSFSSIRRKRTVREVRKLAGANLGLAQSAGIGEVFLLWLLSRVGASSLARIISRELTAVQLPPKAVINLSSPSFVKFVRRQGLNLHYWSVNDVQAMHDLLEIGATGLVTDETANAVTVISLRA